MWAGRADQSDWRADGGAADESGGESGSIVAILCDGGERYADTYYDQAWLKAQGYELEGLIAAVAASAERGEALPTSVLRANI